MDAEVAMSSAFHSTGSIGDGLIVEAASLPPHKVAFDI